MATFYFNRFSNENYVSQWRTYLQNQSYTDDINNTVRNSTEKQTRDFSEIISRQSNEINEAIHSASREQITAIQESTNAICGTLNAGFELLSENLQDISYGIDELRSEVNSMASMLDWKLSLLIEHQKISNLLLGNIAVLLRIPDIQKERQYHIEQGIKFLKNAIFDDDFYDDSLNNLLKAEKIEPTDFFALHRIGLIYMYSIKHLDLVKAEEYFKKAAKYAIAESNAGAGITTNYLAGDTNKNLLNQLPTSDSIKLQAAESYLFAGRCCYIQGKLKEAADLAGKAFSLVPNMLEAGFTQAKALAASNDVSIATNILKTIVEKDRFYTLKIVSDLDLGPQKEIKNLLESFRNNANEKASNLFKEIKANVINESVVNKELDKIEKLINKNTFLHSKKAIDLINKNVERSFSDAFQNQNGAYLSDRNLNELQKLLETLTEKVYYRDSYSSLASLFVYLTEQTQWIVPPFKSLDAALTFTDYQPKKSTSTLAEFVNREKEYFEKLPIVKIRISEAFEKVYKEDDTRKKLIAESREKQENEKRNANEAKTRSYMGNQALTWLGGFPIIVGSLFLVFGFFIGCNEGCHSPKFNNSKGQLTSLSGWNEFAADYGKDLGFKAGIVALIIGGVVFLVKSLNRPKF